MQSIQNVNIQELRKIDIQRAINEEAKRGLCYKSIKSAVDLLRSALALSNVGIPSTKDFKLPAKKVKTEDLPDLKEVMRVIIGSSVELPCLLSLCCGGMRISEVRGLQYKDIVEDENGYKYLKVCRARVCISGRDDVKNQNKTEKSTWVIPIPDYLYRLIPNMEDAEPDDYIIGENYGAIKRRYDRLMKKHGIKMTFHDLRAQFATTMNGLGVEREVLQMLGGWSNSKVLESIYIRIPKHKLIDSLNVYDNYISEIISECQAP